MIPCPEPCENGVSFEVFVAGGETYQDYLIYCAATALSDTEEP